jgi:DNA-binding CsgD family transcriptional regulator
MLRRSSEAEVSMRPPVKSAFNRRVLKIAQPNMDLPHSGIFLIDMSLSPIGSDRGATRILKSPEADAAGARPRVSIPDEILDFIRNRSPADGSCFTAYFLIGQRRYRCRSYVVQCEYPSLGPSLLAVHLEADVSGNDPISEIATNYRLTEREEEALRGIALGLTTKELAHRMEISPNTVKAFVRLIMIKLGVTTRGAIMVKVLDSYEAK